MKELGGGGGGGGAVQHIVILSFLPSYISPILASIPS